jgi:hypothetical protein
MQNKVYVDWIRNLLISKKELSKLNNDELWLIIEELVGVIECMKKQIDNQNLNW